MTELQQSEIEFIEQQLYSFGPTGNILEIGSKDDQLFNNLRNKFPLWKFRSVDEFEKIDGSEQYEVISVGCTANVNFSELYAESKKVLQPNGIIVARDIDSKKYMQSVKRAWSDNALRPCNLPLGDAVKKYPTMPWGTHITDIDLTYHLSQSNRMLSNEDTCKLTGRNKLNRFSKIPFKDSKTLMKYLNGKFNEYFDWHFEYFRSGEPAGLHTDYETITWDHWGEVIDCHTIVGIIIPLEWNCKQPYTVNYNRSSSVPRKLIYRKGDVRYTDTNEIYPYRDKWEFDEQVLKYNPKGTAYYKEYADLKVESVYEWNVGTMMLFDASRWHSSSWFLDTDTVPEEVSVYKQSIIGFGSVDVFRNKSH